MVLFCDIIFYYILGFYSTVKFCVRKRDFNKHIYSVFLKYDKQVIFSKDRYTCRYIERVFLSWCTNKLDIHGNFRELLDLLIDQRAHDCYGLVYFSHQPVKQ